MLFKRLCEFYSKIEATTKRKDMTNLLVALFHETSPDDIDKVIYLTQGKLYPDWTGRPELGVAEKLAIRALSMAVNIPENKIEALYKTKGDLGLVAEELISEKPVATLDTFLSGGSSSLTVNEVYESLVKIAEASGEGAINRRTRILYGLFSKCAPIEARYLMRIVTGKMRLGIADMTILDALSIAFGGPHLRPHLERAYNLTSDLGYVAKVLKSQGIEAVKKITISLGRPIRMMLAQRMSTSEEIIEKMGGLCWGEYKLDGERFQCHKNGDSVQIFSRRLENITSMYPDGVEYIKSHIKARDAVVEGEAVPINPDTGEILPFQELMHRRRKYDIEKMMQRIGIRLYLFDCLYVDGEDLTQKPFYERAKRLREIIVADDKVTPVPYVLTNNAHQLTLFFHEALNNGCEGLVIKSPRVDSIYRAGARSWLWIKLKESYQSKMVEPIDVVVVGGFYGRGRRSGTYGALLVAVYNPEKDVFETICKVGSGFTDEDLDNLPKRLDSYKTSTKPSRVVSKMEPDVWFEPKQVIEIIGDEITLSPVHTAGWGLIQKDAGFAVRFPRFTGRWRDDKGPEDATTVQEILEMYKQQLRKIEE